MYTFLVVLLVLDSIILIAAVLMQAPKGGGLSASFGGASSSPDSFMGTRQAANLLTKASWWCGGIFLLIGFVLTLMSTRGSTPKSVLDQSFTPTQQAPATAPATSTPAVPLTPAQPQGGTKSQSSGNSKPPAKTPQP